MAIENEAFKYINTYLSKENINKENLHIEMSVINVIWWQSELKEALCREKARMKVMTGSLPASAREALASAA